MSGDTEITSLLRLLRLAISRHIQTFENSVTADTKTITLDHATFRSPRMLLFGNNGPDAHLFFRFRSKETGEWIGPYEVPAYANTMRALVEGFTEAEVTGESGMPATARIEAFYV